MKSNLLWLDFSVLHIHLVAAQHHRDLFAHPNQVTVPVWHVLVRHTRSHIKHDDRAFTLDVVTVTEPAKLLLACSVPHVEDDWAMVGLEVEWVHINAEGGFFFFGKENVEKMKLC